MEQYISKSALLAEIEWLVNNYDKALDYEAALEDVRNFLDTLEVIEVDLQGEPQVKESAEIQHVNETCKENGNSLTKEPVSEKLEKAEKFIDEHTKYCSNLAHNEELNGNVWEENTPWLTPDQARKAVEIAKEEVIEQMMAKAVDGVVTFDYYEGDKAYGCVAHDSFCLEDLGLEDRDEVKILILKK